MFLVFHLDVSGHRFLKLPSKLGIDILKYKKYCPHLVPNSSWDYFNDAGWVTATFGDISVQCHMESEGSESKIINDNLNH